MFWRVVSIVRFLMTIGLFLADWEEEPAPIDDNVPCPAESQPAGNTFSGNTWQTPLPSPLSSLADTQLNMRPTLPNILSGIDLSQLAEPPAPNPDLQRLNSLFSKIGPINDTEAGSSQGGLDPKLLQILKNLSKPNECPRNEL